MLYYLDAAVTRYHYSIYAWNATVDAGADVKAFNHAVFWRRMVRGRVEVKAVVKPPSKG